MERMTTMLSIGILFLLVWAIIFWINKITKKPTNQNQQSGGNQNTPQNQPDPVPPTPPSPSKKFSWWKLGISLGIIILTIGFMVRITTPYSEMVTIKKGQDYTFDVYNERIVINPQVHCIHVIYPDYAEYTLCPNVPVNIGEHGVGLYRLQATSNSQIVIISKEFLFYFDKNGNGKGKLNFWMNPKNWNLLFN